MERNAFNSMIDRIFAQMQAMRAKRQMTLGKLIERLEEMPADKKIVGLGKLHSYRGYYEDLAFEPDENEKTVAELLSVCRFAIGKTFVGYKGGEYFMDKNTPLWVAHSGSLGEMLLAINDDGDIVLAKEE